METCSTRALINPDTQVCEMAPDCSSEVLLWWKNKKERQFCKLFHLSHLGVFCPWAWNIVNGPPLPFCLLQPQRPWCEPWSCWTTWRRSMTTVTWRSWAPWWRSSPWTPSWPRWSSPAVNSTVQTRSSPSLPCCQVMLRAGLLCGSELLLFLLFPALMDRVSETTNELMEIYTAASLSSNVFCNLKSFRYYLTYCMPSLTHFRPQKWKSTWNKRNVCLLNLTTREVEAKVRGVSYYLWGRGKIHACTKCIGVAGAAPACYSSNCTLGLPKQNAAHWDESWRLWRECEGSLRAGKWI